MLNNTLGPRKTVDEWKMVNTQHNRAGINCTKNIFFFMLQVFFNWKNQLRTRAKKLKQIQDGKTGADDKLALQKLTDVEKRALKLWKEDFQDKDIASVSENHLPTNLFRFSLHFQFVAPKHFCYRSEIVAFGFQWNST